MPGKRRTIKCVKLIIGHSLVGRLGDQAQTLHLNRRFIAVLRIVIPTKSGNRLQDEGLTRLNQSIDRAFH